MQTTRLERSNHYQRLEYYQGKGIYFHSDACQSFGKVPLHVDTMHLDLLTINSHKIYGPKGAGAFVYPEEEPGLNQCFMAVDKSMVSALQRKIIAGIIGFAEASRLCMHELMNESPRLTSMRKKLVTALEERLRIFISTVILHFVYPEISTSVLLVVKGKVSACS